MERRNRREEMLSQAFEIVAKDGLEALHARSVAAAIGVNHAAVHYYFKRRSDLLLALWDYCLARNAADREKLIDAAKSPAKKLEGEIALAEAYSKPSSRFLKVFVSLFVAAQSDEWLLAALQEHWKKHVLSLKEELRRADKDDDLASGTPFKDPELLLATLLGLGIASQLMGARLSGGKPFDRVADSLIR